MSTLTDLLAAHTGLSGDAAEHLQTVVAEWQLLADLSFADFLMWVLDSDVARDGEQEFVCVAQARPTTGATARPEDVVGARVTRAEHPHLARALSEVRMVRDTDPHWHAEVATRREAIPVTYRGEVIAVLSRETNLTLPRVPSSLEIAYLAGAADLCQMIADGTFPTAGSVADVHTSPRVGDGFIRLDSSGSVVFASPNGSSAYHRMGHEAELVGAKLAPLTKSLIADPFDAAQIYTRNHDPLEGRPGSRAEAESRRGAVVLFRALPLRPAGVPAGALVLVRDVTEVKRRDRALLSKDATIREIHHRVKNNLQTVAALLRLQSRRTPSERARQALADSVRRVTSIAMVHETLSMSVDERVNLDQLLDKVMPVLSEVTTAESSIKLTREGSFGVVVADIATPLVMVLAELVQNAAEHAFDTDQSGTVTIAATSSARWLDVTISDDGKGLPAGFSLERAEGLGLQIVRTLVESELRGSLTLRENQPRGTAALLRIPLQRRL
jgi:two-component system, sensor histidine kinase PdtaS